MEDFFLGGGGGVVKHVWHILASVASIYGACLTSVLEGRYGCMMKLNSARDLGKLSISIRLTREGEKVGPMCMPYT